MTTLDTTTTKPTGECHPACRLLPALSDEQFAELVADISNYGQRHPIIVDQAGVILDGRHRFRALQELSMEPKVQTFRGKEAEKVALVISENIRRRHLTDQQRAHVAAELADMARGGDRGNQHKDGRPPIGGLGITTAQAAELVQVPQRSVERAKQMMRTDPEAHEKAKAGTLGKRKPTPKPKTVDGHREQKEHQSRGLRSYVKIDLVVALRQLDRCFDAPVPGVPFNPEAWFADQPEFRHLELWKLVEDLQVNLRRLQDAMGPAAEQRGKLSDAVRAGLMAAFGDKRAEPSLSPPESVGKLSEELANVEAPDAAPARMKTYTCRIPGCGEFQGPVQRGQPPKYCPVHRAGGHCARLARAHGISQQQEV